jgi:hypothetical protein
MTDAPAYLRARDIARLTGMSVRTARRWIAKRILASGKVGGARLYLEEIRPALLRHSEHDGLWASYHGHPLRAGRLYDIVRARIIAKFGKDMCIHDFRRAAATFLAMDAPEKIGLIPGVLQHASPDPGDQHYNLKRTVQSGRRFAAHLANARNRPLATQSGIMGADTGPRRRRTDMKMHIDRPARDDALLSSGAIKRRGRGEPSCA